MEISQYQVMYDVEDTHFWYVGMRAVTSTLLNNLALPAHSKILDAGCGTGANLSYLSQYGRVIGIDLSPEAVRFSQQRGYKSVKIASINKLPFPDQTFDLVTNFDVLGSIGVNQVQALSEFYRILKPGGYLLVRVSAYQSLFSKHDVLVHTKSRYTKDSLTKLMDQTPFKIVSSTYANTFFFLPLAIRRLWQKRFVKKNITPLEQSDVTRLPNWVNTIGILIMSLEALLIRFTNLPFGFSLILIARKPLE